MHQNIEAIDYKEETKDIIRKFEQKKILYIILLDQQVNQKNSSFV